jgi:hypothetical protein
MRGVAGAAGAPVHNGGIIAGNAPSHVIVRELD